MDIIKELLSKPLFWGFLIGFALCVLSMAAHYKTKRELKRLKGHLSDKLEIEAEKMGDLKGQIETLKSENENLRLKIGSGRSHNDKLDLERELEIFARAERKMNSMVPGFPPAWEKAKERSAEELLEEERGKSIPRRIFRRFFSKSEIVDGEVIEALPEHSGTKNESESPSPAESSSG